jgi:hypothetical protein
VFVAGAVEGLVDEAVLKRLVREAGATLGPVHGRQGKSRILKHLEGYNSSASRFPWVVLIDLNGDASCAPALRRELLPRISPFLCFRIAVREIESWVMADRERFASFLGVPLALVPASPESERDPKARVVALARRSSRREIREDMVPSPGSGRVAGPAYDSRLTEFALNAWRPGVAGKRAASLAGTIRRLKRLVGRWKASGYLTCTSSA